MQYNDTTYAVIQYIKSSYDRDPEFLWVRTPTNAAFRHGGSKKWFGALLLDMPSEKLGLPGGRRVDILDLKCDPRMIGSLIDGKSYLPGYHMNKEHWITLVLDGTIPLQQITALIDISYTMTAGKK